MNNQETINSLVIDILKGAKETGAEIYGITKEGLVQAVGFAQEQAPLVIQEFLTWKFYEAGLDILMSLVILGILGIIYYIIHRWSKELESFDKTMTRGICSFLLFASFIVLYHEGLMNIHTPVKTMIQIKVAPRVYLIEYVSEQVKQTN